MNIIFEPFLGVGPLKFGMSISDVESALKMMSGVDDCSYQEGKLCAFSFYPSDIKQLLFAGKDVLKMNRLSAALYFADQSNDYGQAQGGSLYFMDLGCAILQYESSIREFLFFAREYNTREPLRKMSPISIKEHYEDNTYDDQENLICGGDQLTTSSNGIAPASPPQSAEH